MELITMFIGVLFMGLTNLAKKKGINQKAVTLAFAWGAAILYTTFVTFTTAEFQADVVMFALSTLGTAKLVYDIATMNKVL